MADRSGVVYIAPDAWYLPQGRLVDPEAFTFGLHWEDWDDEKQIGVIRADGGKVVGAAAAIAWGRERCDRVLIRLAHTHESHFSAGCVELTDKPDGSGQAFPTWPPNGPPSEGWWTPVDEAAAEGEGSVEAGG